MNYNLEIGKSFAGIDFNYPVDKVMNLLGQPDSKYIDDLSMYLKYNELGLYISFEKENKKWTDLGIQTERVVYEGKKWNEYNKKDLFKIIKKIYLEKKYPFEFDTTEIDCTNEKQYNFYEIGVTLFFDKDKFKSIALSKPMD